MKAVRRTAVAIFYFGAILLATQAVAEGRRVSGGDDAVRKAQYMLRQLSQEKTELQAENARIAGERDALQEKIEKLDKNLARKGKQLDRASANNDKLVDRVKSDNDKMRALIEKLRTTVRMLRVEKTNVALLTNAVEERNHWIDTCKANNDSLYKVNMELVDRYEGKGIWQALKQAEPFTGINGVELEVVAQNYEYRIEDLQVANFEASDAEKTFSTSLSGGQ